MELDMSTLRIFYMNILDEVEFTSFIHHIGQNFKRSSLNRQQKVLKLILKPLLTFGNRGNKDAYVKIFFARRARI